ncbi:hypothetical protein GCM10010228_35520 [Streptomyces massasporeus]|nr:hypothetical protein GCM10010228_35520 [Streptomyces massasporeus]
MTVQGVDPIVDAGRAGVVQTNSGRGRVGWYSVEGSLVIGECGCGTFHRLVVTGRDAGRVWFDDPDWGGLTRGPDFRDWYLAWLATP